jgi:hypothetical protein
MQMRWQGSINTPGSWHIIQFIKLHSYPRALLSHPMARTQLNRYSVKTKQKVISALPYLRDANLQ